MLEDSDEIFITVNKWHINEVLSSHNLQHRIYLKELSLYYEKTIKKHLDWTEDAHTAFQFSSDNFSEKIDKVLYSMQYFTDTLKKIWQHHKKNVNSFILIWEYFEVFLLKIIKNSVNCMLTAAQQFKETKQKLNQSVYSFNVYLSTLKAQLSLYSEEYKVQHLFTQLHQEIHMTLMNYQELSDSQNAHLLLTS